MQVGRLQFTLYWQSVNYKIELVFCSDFDLRIILVWLFSIVAELQSGTSFHKWETSVTSNVRVKCK